MRLRTFLIFFWLCPDDINWWPFKKIIVQTILIMNQRNNFHRFVNVDSFVTIRPPNLGIWGTSLILVNTFILSSLSYHSNFFQWSFQMRSLQLIVHFKVLIGNQIWGIKNLMKSLDLIISVNIKYICKNPDSTLELCRPTKLKI